MPDQTSKQEVTPRSLVLTFLQSINPDNDAIGADAAHWLMTFHDLFNGAIKDIQAVQDVQALENEFKKIVQSGTYSDYIELDSQQTLFQLQLAKASFWNALTQRGDIVQPGAGVAIEANVNLFKERLNTEQLAIFDEILEAKTIEVSIIQDIAETIGLRARSAFCTLLSI